MAKRGELTGPERARLQPKLQMIANGSAEVNAVRAEQCAGLRVTSNKLLDAVERRRTPSDAAVTAAEVRLPARGKVTQLASNVEASVFVQLNAGSVGGDPLPGERARNGDVVAARVPLNSLPTLTRDSRVAFVEIGEPLNAPTPVLGDATASAPSVAERRFGTAAQHHFGADVLIGIIDVQGFDFSHPDFLDAQGNTRFVAIWDQDGTGRPSPSPAGTQLGYGAELTREHLNSALKAAPALGVPAYEIERQSQLAEGSHGTHVASTAAGNRGICRRSPIAGVLIGLPDADVDRRRSFYDSTRIVDAVGYLTALAARLGKALSINISLGTNGHAHDGSGAIGRWIDSIMSTPGRVVSVAAGNAGQERAERPDDLGWISGRIHAHGRVPAAGLDSDLEWVVVGNGIVDISENELELWFNPQDRFAVSLRTPQGTWIGPVEPRQFVENRRLADGSFVSIYNELYHPSNGANYMGIYLSPNLKTTPVVGVTSGTWLVRIHGLEIRDGRYDAWIERDDPRPVFQDGPRQVWAFPSFFSERSTADDSTVGSLGCGHRVLTVANLDSARNVINISSSQGPTRDGRTKPDVAAPGTDIVAAKGFAIDGSPWIAMTGTSMASPFVCGIAGLMLSIDPTLTAAQIEGIIRSTARPLPGASFTWTNDAGFGVIDPARCLTEAAMAATRTDRTKER